MTSQMQQPTDGCTQCGNTDRLEWTGNEWLCADCLTMEADEASEE